jgi:hypothetical protein
MSNLKIVDLEIVVNLNEFTSLVNH